MGTLAAHSVAGSGIYAMVQDRVGNREDAIELRKEMGKAGAKAGITAGVVAATVGVTISTAGMGMPAAIATGAAAGAAAGAGATAGVQAIEGKVNPGDVVGNGLMGMTAGAVAGGVTSQVAARAIAADVEAVAIGEAVGTRPLVMSAATRAVVGAGAGGLSRCVIDDMLEATRTRVQQRRESPVEECTENNIYTNLYETQFNPALNSTYNIMPDEVEMLECAICLETEAECPGIVKVHRCTKHCESDDSSCCPHAFHRDCIQEWRIVCNQRNEPFTCPECRRFLPNSASKNSV